MLHSVRIFFSRAMFRQVVWLSRERKSFNGEPSAATPRIVVLGREHYEERKVNYAIQSWRGLRSVLRLELGTDGRTLYHINPPTDGGREVTFFRLKEHATSKIEGALFCFPETLLLSSLISETEVARVTRDGLEYYLARGFASQIRGGTISDPRLYALSVGMPEDVHVRELQESFLLESLPGSLPRLTISDWWTFFVGRERWLQRLPLKQIGTACLLALVIYLGAISFYLESALWIRQKQLASLSSDVSLLMEKQRSIDVAAKEMNGLFALSRERFPTYQLWAVLAEMWRSGGVLLAVSIDGDEVTLRGTSQASNQVLATLSKIPTVRNARFDAPVRSDFGNETFTITLTLVEEK